MAISTMRQAFLSAVLLMLPISRAFYMPGVHPQTFSPNAEVAMKVNSMTSIHTQIPKDYYRLPFCRPEGGPQMMSENLGEFLTGNKIQSSPYAINMLREVYCSIVCQVVPDKKSTRDLKLHVKYGYHNNWIIDNLPSASLGLSEKGYKLKHYAGGFPIGFMDSATKNSFIFNHVNINIDYHQVEGSVAEEYRVVGFSVEPISINHRFANDYKWDGESYEGYRKPLLSCPSPGVHMSQENNFGPQIVEEDVPILFTYDVLWNPSSVEWASRWDVYLTEDNMVPAKVHWYSITNSILVVVFLSLLVAQMFLRSLRNDIAAYNAVVTDEERDEEIDETGWKLIHADVFRPPTTNSMIYCVFVGSGVQLSITAFFSIIFSAIGFLSPARRGSLMTMTLVFYMMCGVFGGYTSSRMYKSFRGRHWQMCTLLTALFFPGVSFSLFLMFNVFLAFYHSSGSVPLLDVIILASMWCFVSIPLVFLGSYFGYKKEPMSFPTNTSTIARVIPEPSMFLNPKLIMIGTGMLPFAGAYVEIFFIMTSLWMDQYYYIFGFTLLVYLIVLITCAEITVLLCYYQLCAENHRWWWFSFVTSGSVSFYVFAFACIWFKQLESSKIFMTYLLYFGYMFLVSLGVFLITGMVGSMSCFFADRKSVV